MKLIKHLLLFSAVLLVYSCSGGETPKTSNSNNNSQRVIVSPPGGIEEIIEISGTTIFGTVLDTAYSSLEDVKVSTRPRTVETLTDEQGEFSLSSENFISDLSYDIVFTHIDYEQKTTSGFYPDIDENNDLGLILMIPLELDEGGDGPGGGGIPPTPPEMPEDSGRD